MTWLQIEDSNYYINENGAVINKKDKIMKTRILPSGYNTIHLYINKKRKCCYIHRLVAEAFLDNPNNLPDIHHKDFNKSNNNVNNLEWSSRSDNCRFRNFKKKNGLPRGVSWNSVVKKYQTQISYECKIKHLGYFNTIEEAHNKYLETYKKLTGCDCIYN